MSRAHAVGSTAGGVAAIAGVLGAVGISNSVEGKDGQWVRLGQRNSATRTTQITGRKSPGLLARISGAGAAIRGITSSEKGTGVQGWADAKKGKTTGLDGKTQSPGGVAGRFVAARGGTAILARSPDRNGTALRTGAGGQTQFDQHWVRPPPPAGPSSSSR